MNKTGKIQNIYIYFAAFISGAVIMALELLSARILAPFYGTSIYVWASVISTTLFILSLGYWIGGKAIDKFPSISTLSNILFICGFTLLLLMISSKPLSGFFSDFGIIAGSLSSSLLLLTFPLVLLGMIVPSAIRLKVSALEKSGSAAGQVMAISTAGSIFGTLISGLIFIPFFGIRKSILILAVCVFFLAIIGFLFRKKYLHLMAGFFICICSITITLKMYSMPQYKNAKILEYREGFYGDIAIVDIGMQRMMLVNDIVQSGVNLFMYDLTMEEFKKGSHIASRNYLELLPYFFPDAKNALLIGLGAGIHHYMLESYGINAESVELDPDVVKLAQKYFNFRGKVHVEDGRIFLRKNKNKYDMIVLDVFSSEIMPIHLYTIEAFKEVKERLNKKGILAVHLINSPAHLTTKSILKTLYSVFPEVILYQSGIGNEIQQLYCFASLSKLQLSGNKVLEQCGFLGNEIIEVNWVDGKILTDDNSSLDVMNSDVALAWRKISRRDFKLLSVN